MSKFFQQLKEFYGKLDSRARKILIGASSAAIVALLAVGWWASQINYVPLMSGESMDKVRRVAGVLEAEGVPYEVSNDGMERNCTHAPTSYMITVRLQQVKTHALRAY